MSEATKKQVLLMCVGIVLHNLILFAICLIWFRRASVFLGLLAGAAAAVVLLASMARSAELCVEIAEEKSARRKMTAHMLFRTFFLLVLAAVLWKFTDINILAMAFGCLGLKTGAYLYPAVKRLYDRRAGK